MADRLPAAQRRERVLQSALELFADQGYAASMGDVAKAAGITRTVLYHYFPSKERLFTSVLETAAGELLHHLAPAIGGTDEQVVRARATTDALVDFLADRPRAWDVLFLHHDEDEPEAAAARERVHERAMAAFAVMFAADLNAAGIDADSVRGQLFGEMQLGAVVAAGRWWRAHAQTPRADVADAVFALLWHGTSRLGDDT